MVRKTKLVQVFNLVTAKNIYKKNKIANIKNTTRNKHTFVDRKKALQMAKKIDKTRM